MSTNDFERYFQTTTTCLPEQKAKIIGHHCCLLRVLVNSRCWFSLPPAVDHKVLEDIVYCLILTKTCVRLAKGVRLQCRPIIVLPIGDTKYLCFGVVSQQRTVITTKLLSLYLHLYPTQMG